MMPLEDRIPLYILFFFSSPLCEVQSKVCLKFDNWLVNFFDTAISFLLSLFWFFDIPKVETVIYSFKEGERGREKVEEFREEISIVSSRKDTVDTFVHNVYIFARLGPNRSLDVFHRSILFHPRSRCHLQQCRHHSCCSGGTKMKMQDENWRRIMDAERLRLLKIKIVEDCFSIIADLREVFCTTFKNATFTRIPRLQYVVSQKTRSCINKIPCTFRARKNPSFSSKNREYDWTKFLNRAGYK